jgi:hypothetical protein
MLVGGVIFENLVHGFAVRNLILDGIQEADELLMPMALHVATNDLTVENVERGKQRRRSVPLVIMGHRADASLFQWQAGLGTIKCLNLALLIDG